MSHIRINVVKKALASIGSSWMGKVICIQTFIYRWLTFEIPGDSPDDDLAPSDILNSSFISTYTDRRIYQYLLSVSPLSPQ